MDTVSAYQSAPHIFVMVTSITLLYDDIPQLYVQVPTRSFNDNFPVSGRFRVVNERSPVRHPSLRSVMQTSEFWVPATNDPRKATGGSTSGKRFRQTRLQSSLCSFPLRGHSSRSTHPGLEHQTATGQSRTRQWNFVPAHLSCQDTRLLNL